MDCTSITVSSSRDDGSNATMAATLPSADLTWVELTDQFFTLLGGFGYILPDTEKLLDAIEEVSNEEFKGNFVGRS